MAISFIGDVSWQAVEDPFWTVDSYGTDHASVLFRGSRLLKPAFEALLEKERWSTMDGFNGMRLANWQGVQITPNFPGITLNFIGFRSGTIPPVKIVDSEVTQSASGQGTLSNLITQVGGNAGAQGGGQQVTGSFVYKASRTTYTWFETAKPALLPKYNQVTDRTDPLSPGRIISYSLQSIDSDHPAIVPFSAFAAVFNNLVRRVFVSEYERDQLIPNALWGCRAVVEFQVVS